MCVNCGKTRPASEGRDPLPECEHPDYPGLTACTWDVTPEEAWQHWRKAEHEQREATKAALARAEAAEVARDDAKTEAAAARAFLLAISEMIDNATQSPQTVDRWLDRIEEVCKAATRPAALARAEAAEARASNLAAALERMAKYQLPCS